jgi:hypothetical protein
LNPIDILPQRNVSWDSEIDWNDSYHYSNMSSNNSNYRGRSPFHRSGGRGFRGRSKSRGRGSKYYSKSNKSSRYNSTSTTKEYKFAPHTHGNTTYATYSTVKDVIITYMKKHYKTGLDIAKSIKEGDIIDMTIKHPTHEISTETEDADREMEQKGFDIKYQEELGGYMDKLETFEQELAQVYALIFGSYCTKTMQQRIEEHPDFEKKIENNPVELLKAVQTLTNDPVRARYPYASMHDALTKLIKTRQLPNENSLDYSKRLKQESDALTSYVGKQIFIDFVKQSDEYRNESDQQKKADMELERYDCWLSYLLLHNSDPLKYGSILKGLQSPYYLGNDQYYPKTLSAAIDVLLSNHKLDPAYYENQKKQKRENQQR